MLILALGIILNTRSGLGVSPIISVAYSIATVGEYNFGNTTFMLYAVFVIIEILLHTIDKYRRKDTNIKLKAQLLKDILQLPLSLIFTRFMNLFSSFIPVPEGIVLKLVVLFLGIILTGIGAAMSLNMRLIPNPGDGIVQTIADFINKSVGLAKNGFDLLNICFTICFGIICNGKPVGIGIGTIIAVLGVGRVIAAFNRIFKGKMLEAAGIKHV